LRAVSSSMSVFISLASLSLFSRRNLWIPGSRGACHRARIRATRWRAPE
jgi:hypothetical protein